MSEQLDACPHEAMKAASTPHERMTLMLMERVDALERDLAAERKTVDRLRSQVLQMVFEKNFYFSDNQGRRLDRDRSRRS